MDIIIVEDEYWALLELKTLLKIYEINHNICYFDNGEEAFEHIKENKPDLVITDITMPRMNGLELIENVKSMDPSIECILLTVHETFDYAKKGIQLGVADYLLKPIKKDTLFQVIDRSVESINKKKLAVTEKQYWSINQLLFHKIDQSNQSIEMFDNQSFVLLYMLFGNWKADVNWETAEIRIKGMEEQFGVDREVWSLSIDNQRKLLIVSCDSDQDVSDFPIVDMFQSLKKENQVHLCCIKKTVETSLTEAYLKAHKLIDKQKLFGESTLIFNEEIDQSDALSTLWITSRIIEKQLQKGEYSSISQQIKQLINQIKSLKIPQKQLFQFLLDFYYAIVYKLQQVTCNVVKIDKIDERFDKLESLVTFDEFEKWIENLILKISQSSTPKDIAPKHLIPKVKDWISECYADNITFQQFADEHHVSLSYLSREFKEQTNMNFSDYLINYRIKKSIELLENGLIMTKEIGPLVGYHDPKHFRAIFKRITGKTPTEYKRKD